MTVSAWTDDRVGRLKTLWIEGRSAAEIARVLDHGLTRSAVLGKVHRLGLSAGHPPASRSARAAPGPAAPVPAARRSSPAKPVPPSRPESLVRSAMDVGRVWSEDVVGGAVLVVVMVVLVVVVVVMVVLVVVVVLLLVMVFVRCTAVVVVVVTLSEAQW